MRQRSAAPSLAPAVAILFSGASGAALGQQERPPMFRPPLVVPSHTGGVWAGRPYGLAAADFLGSDGMPGQDGYPELVVVNSGCDLLRCEPAAWGLVSVFWNTGDWESGASGLELIQEIRLSPGLGTEVLLTDLDGANGPDIVVAATQWVQRGPDAGLYIAMNDGAGGFRAAVKHSMPLGLSGLVVTDLDADGRTDDIVGATADCPLADGTPLDFLWVKLGDGQGGFANQWPVKLAIPGGAAPVDLVAGDFFRGEGPVMPDFVAASPTSDAYTVVENLGGGQFRALAASRPGGCDGDWGLRTLAAARLDADEFEDFVGVAGLHAMVFLGDGAGGFTSHCDDARLRYQLREDDEAPPAFAHGLAIGQLNGGAGLDVAVAIRNLAADQSQVAILLGRGDGTFQTSSPTQAYLYSVDGDPDDPEDVAAPLGVLIADLNADGLGDIVTSNHLSDTISILIGAGLPDATAGP